MRIPAWLRKRLPTGDAHGLGADERATRDRAVLVEACVELADLMPSEALRRRAQDALGAAGVETVQAVDGAAFDPTRFKVADRVPTSDPSLHNRIAATERPGYVDRGRSIRACEVLVYSLEDRS